MNGSIVIEDVIENSPGAKSGFKPNDIILSVENNFTNNLQAYKQTLQSAGNTIKVIAVTETKFLILKCFII